MRWSVVLLALWGCGGGDDGEGTGGPGPTDLPSETGDTGGTGTQHTGHTGVTEPTGDTGHTGDTGSSGTDGIPGPDSCLFGVTPKLPSERIARTDSSPVGFGIDAMQSCDADVWTVTFQTLSALERHEVDVQAFDLATGELLGSFAADRLGASDPYIDWRAQAALPCGDGVWFSALLTGVDGTEVAGAIETDGLVRASSGSYSSVDQVFTGTAAAEDADEVWMWLVYPHLPEAYGPFPAHEDPQGVWTSELVLSDLDVRQEGAVRGFIGCADGAIIGVDGL